MYDYLSGEIVAKEEGFCILDNHGVGYKIYVSKRQMLELTLGEEKKLYVYHHVKEDEESLYGFTSVYERNVFQLMTSVPGVGVRLALRSLDETNPEVIILDLYKENVVNLKKIKGLGEKLIKKMILELKPKLLEYLTVKEVGNNETEVLADSDLKEALRALGYKEVEITRLFSHISFSEGSLEDNLRIALSQLSKFK